MNRDCIISSIAEDVLQQIERRIDTDTYDDLRQFPLGNGNFETENTGIQYILDISGGIITDGIIYNKEGYPHPRLTDYLMSHFPDLSDRINEILEEKDIAIEPSFWDMVDEKYAEYRDAI